jgi:hypothetical protein
MEMTLAVKQQDRLRPSDGLGHGVAFPRLHDLRITGEDAFDLGWLTDDNQQSERPHLEREDLPVALAAALKQAMLAQ